MKLIVGLGNPGRSYMYTRHNMGFMCVDHLSKRWNIPWSERRKYAVLALGKVGEEPVVLVKPRTFMNNSGQGVDYVLTRFRCAPSDLMVIYDEMDLPLGTIRLRPKGNSAGHNGMTSIIQALGTTEIPRLRVGVGTPQEERDDIEYLLSAFAFPERQAVRGVIERAGDSVECVLREGIDAAMNRFN